MKRQRGHRKLRDETAEWQGGCHPEVTPPPGTKSEEYVRHTLTHTRNCTWRRGPRTEPQEPKYSRVKEEAADRDC